MMIYGVNKVQMPQKNFNLKPVSAVKPSSVTDNLREGGYYSVLWGEY